MKNSKLKFREGEFIKLLDEAFFEVKGLVHPPRRVIAYPRYIPYEKGKRKLGRITYRKVYHMSERIRVIKKLYSQYLIFDEVFDETLCEVPKSDIRRKMDPVKGLMKLKRRENLDEVERTALELASLIKERSGISWNSIGITGSVLLGLHTKESDIDLIVYGRNQSLKAYEALKELRKENIVKPHSVKDLIQLHNFRSKDTPSPLEDFIETESKKVVQGIFMGRWYFMRFVKDWSEVEEEYGSIKYRKLGYATIKAVVIDDSESLFTPCKYLVDNVKVIEGVKVNSIREIASFRGRFCEHARKGEKLIARGKVELLIENENRYARLLVGASTSDYMIVA